MADPYTNIEPYFAQRLQALIQAAEAAGHNVGLGSGYRTEAEQAVLYDRYRRGVPGQARAAPPGRSQHNHGLAYDLKMDDAAESWVHAHAGQFGLYFPMDDEPWHIQPIGVGGGSSSSHAHGLEAAGVKPEDEMASRLASIQSILLGAPPSADTPEDVTEPYVQAYRSNMFKGLGQQAMKGFTPADTTTIAEGDAGNLQKYAQSQFQKYGWDPSELQALITLWNKESGWNPRADNPTSSAAGIAQKLQSVHGPVESTGQAQIDWGLNYIADRYGTPSAALRFHLSKNWY